MGFKVGLFTVLLRQKAGGPAIIKRHTSNFFLSGTLTVNTWVSFSFYLIQFCRTQLASIQTPKQVGV